MYTLNDDAEPSESSALGHAIGYDVAISSNKASEEFCAEHGAAPAVVFDATAEQFTASGPVD